MIYETTRRLGIMLLTIIIVPFIAGLYGILHDQLTYSISEEYYTRFKFIQFGLWENTPPAHVDHPRICVAVVGFMATWWTGLLIGPLLALTGLIHREARVMWRANVKAVLLALVVTFITGLTGLTYGWLVLADRGVNWPLPQGLVDQRHFIMVGSMHNFSYLGGLIGMICGIVLHFRMKRNQMIRRD